MVSHRAINDIMQTPKKEMHSSSFQFVVLFLIFFFFNCYLAAPRPTLGHYRGDSFNHPMLITAFYIFDPRVIGSLVAERLVRIVPATFRFWLQRLNPLGHIRIWIIYIKILKKNVVAHVFLKVKYRLSTNLELAILCDQELNWKFAPSLWGLKTCIT